MNKSFFKKSLLTAALAVSAIITGASAEDLYNQAQLQTFIDSGIGNGDIQNDIVLTSNLNPTNNTNGISLIGEATNTVISGNDTFSGFVFGVDNVINTISDFSINNMKSSDHFGSALANLGTITNLGANFNNNSINGVQTGGAVYNAGYIENVTGNFSNNSIVKTSEEVSAFGGALYNRGIIGNVTGDFSYNSIDSAKDGYGAALHNDRDEGIGQITNIISNFSNNSNVAEGNVYGGTLYNNGTIQNITSNFSNNTAQGKNIQGGVILNYLYGSDTAAVINKLSGNFTDNSAAATVAKAYGGVIYNGKNSIMNIGDATFTSNSTAAETTAYGGAIYNDGSSMNIKDTNFNSNITTSTNDSAYGCTIYNKSTMNIEDTTFTSNSVTATNGSARGGAINNTSTGTINIENATFTGNNATGTKAGGGAIYNSGNINLENTTFTENKATGTNEVYGGAINNTGTGTINIENATFTENKAIGDTNTTKVNSGAIYNSGKLNLTGINIFKDNYTKIGESEQIANDIYNSNTLNINDGITVLSGGIKNSKGTTTIAEGATLKVLSGATIQQNMVINGTLNLANGGIDNKTVAGGTFSGSGHLKLDIANGQIDNIKASNTTTSISISALNIHNELTKDEEYTYLTSVKGATGDVRAAAGGVGYRFTNTGRKLTVAGITPDKSLVSTIATKSYISYSLLDNETLDDDLGTLAEPDSGHRDFTIFGNDYTLDGQGNSGIEILAGQTFNLHDITMTGFKNNPSTDYILGTVINNSGAIGEITGNFIKNETETSGNRVNIFGGVINNNYDSSIGIINANFEENKISATTNLEFSTIDEEEHAYAYSTIDGSIINNDYAGAINSISGNFIKNEAILDARLNVTSTGSVRSAQTTSSAAGGVISNYFDSSIGNINANFEDNKINSISTVILDGKSKEGIEVEAIGTGGAIANYGSINSIAGNFIRNKINATSTATYTGVKEKDVAITAFASGGAIYNSGSITAITGNFEENSLSAKGVKEVYANGGAIRNEDASIGKIGNSTTPALFSKNTVFASGTGDVSANGGAIHNSADKERTSSIGTITATFVENSAISDMAYANGGAISNYAEKVEPDSAYEPAKASIGLKNVIFNGNYVQSGDDTNIGKSAKGGAIYNEGRDAVYTEGKGAIITLSGTNIFENNYATTNTTAANEGAFGGAVYNEGKNAIIIFTGTNTFKNNYVVNNGVATLNDIYNAGILNIKSGTTSLNSGIIQNGGRTIIDSGATLNITNGEFSYSSLKGNGSAISNNGILNITGTNNFSDNIIDVHNDGKFNITGKVSMASGISGNGTTTLGNGVNPAMLVLGPQATFAQNTVNFNNGTLNIANGTINTLSFDTLKLTGPNNVILADASLVYETMDSIYVSNFENTANNTITLNPNLPSNTLNILTNPNIILYPIDKAVTGSTRYNLARSINAVLPAQIVSPIYVYTPSYNKATGTISVTADSFNSSVLSSSTAAQAGAYTTLVNTYDQAFANMDQVMLMPRAERTAWRNANKFAAQDANNGIITYDPNQIPEEGRGVWFRPFATFENVPLNNGPKVDNFSYGGLVGGDSDMIELKHGWDMVWGAYAGYNGSHQKYDEVSMYQNGGTLGLNATLYKGDFFTGLTANVGANGVDASTQYGKEDFAMLTTGIASKTGYNWELFDSKFIIQPSFLMSYSFINTFDYTNAAGVSIHQDPLNAIQLVPGLKFIGNLPHGWQPYLGVSMVWNLLDKTHFYANDVSLPDMSVDPYVQYGVGVQKRWGDRFTGFGQVMLRNGGRNGVSLNAGFRYELGKNGPKSNPKASIKINKRTQISLSAK